MFERERENKRRGKSKSCALGWILRFIISFVFRTELEALTRRWDLGCNLNSMFFFGGGTGTSSSWGCIGFQTGVGMSQFPRNYSIWLCLDFFEFLCCTYIYIHSIWQHIAKDGRKFAKFNSRPEIWPAGRLGWLSVQFLPPKRSRKRRWCGNIIEKSWS